MRQLYDPRPDKVSSVGSVSKDEPLPLLRLCNWPAWPPNARVDTADNDDTTTATDSSYTTTVSEKVTQANQQKRTKAAVESGTAKAKDLAVPPSYYREFWDSKGKGKSSGTAKAVSKPTQPPPQVKCTASEDR